MSDPTRPQKDPKEGKIAILPLVIADLQTRSDTGAKKYGSVLKSDNGRDALIDAYQEAMDLVMYLRQLIEEKVTKWGEFTQKHLTTGELANAQLRDFVPMGEVVPIPMVEFFRPIPDPAVSSKKETVLEEAQRLVHGDRGEMYGHPIFDLTRTADIATAVLREKLRPGTRLEAEDIAKFQIGTKLSRETHRPKRDNRVDGPGYFEVLDMINQWREANPNKDPRDHYDREHPATKEGK